MKAVEEGEPAPVYGLAVQGRPKEEAPVDDSATTLMRFETPAPLALEAAFDGGRITSDGGLLWIAEADRDLGVSRPWPSTSPSGAVAGRSGTRCSPWCAKGSTR